MTAPVDPRTKPTAHLKYVSVLADIAMAAALHVYDPDYVVTGEWQNGDYGYVRDRWLQGDPQSDVREAVLGLASAGATALTHMPAEKLLDVAARYGIALTPTMAEAVARHFAERREEVLTYRH